MFRLITVFRMEKTNFQTKQFGYLSCGPELWLSVAMFPSSGEKTNSTRIGLAFHLDKIWDPGHTGEGIWSPFRKLSVRSWNN